MGLDHKQERYIKVFVKDTSNWLLGPWQARAMLPLIMRKLDRAGILDLGEEGIEALAVHTSMPIEIVETGLSWWIQRGTLKLVRGNLVMPNFMEAQEATQDDAQRARESRARRREVAMAVEAGLVTKRDDDVTNRDDRAGTSATTSTTAANGAGATAVQAAYDVTKRDATITKRDAVVTKADDTVTTGHNQSLLTVLNSTVLNLAVLNQASETTEISAAPRPGSGEPASSLAADVREVFEYWATKQASLTGSSFKSLRLSKARQTKIRARLREKYSVVDLKLGVDGVFSLDFNVKEGHTDIELVCRDASKLDRYIAAGNKLHANGATALTRSTTGQVINGQIVRYDDG
jgi:hypothetical protein